MWRLRYALLFPWFGLLLADSEQDRALAALQRGEIRPLVELIPIIEADLGGQLVEIELERRGATWVYEAEVLGTNGLRLERDYDAATGAALGKPVREDDDDGDDD
jgi:uncharacterized membrane protein YkoI